MNPFDAMYAAGTPPWDVGAPQEAFVRLAREREVHGKVIDLGCGTGDNALHVASLGLPTLGIDVATRAIQRARAKAVARDLKVDFLVHDALNLSALGATFDTFLDCGLFHSLSDAGRARYGDSLAAAAKVGSTLHLMCMSDREPEWGGPRRIAANDLAEAFADRWVVHSIDEAIFQTRIHEEGARAWLLRATFVGRRSRVVS